MRRFREPGLSAALASPERATISCRRPPGWIGRSREATMAESYDAIIIGAGHNGLVCAAYLARAGLRTLVLERRGVLGGACVTEEVWPGYRVSTASYVMSLLQPKIIKELELRKFGYEVLPTDHLVRAVPGRAVLRLLGRHEEDVREIAKFSRKDAETYPVFEAFLHDAAKFVRELLWKTPPNPCPGGRPTSRRWSGSSGSSGGSATSSSGSSTS